MVPLGIFVSQNLVPVRFAPAKSDSDKFTSFRSAPDRLAPDRFVKTRSAPDKYAAVKSDFTHFLVAINEFSALIDEENKDILKQAGCPLDKPFVKIEGTVTTPDLSGDVSGKLTCKILFVTVVSLEFSGTLTGRT